MAGIMKVTVTMLGMTNFKTHAKFYLVRPKAQ